MTTKQFNKLSNNKKRIAVAQDVLDQLEARKYIAKAQNYATISNLKDVEENTELQEFLVKENPKCTVCAVGSFFVSMVRLGNHCNVDEKSREDSYNSYLKKQHTNDVNGDLIHDKIAEIFGEERHEIETAFEGRTVSDELLEYCENNDLDFDVVLENCKLFYHKYKTDGARLKAIASNIIRNNGKFIPVKIVKTIDG